jgi:NADH-quinone oxidoreductase subunit N
VVSRWPALLPELLLALALFVAYGVLVFAGERRGRTARRALVAGAVLALAACGVTLGQAEDFLFAGYRVDAFTQFAKAVVLLGLVAAVLLEWRDEGRWADERGVAPFFLGAGALSLLVAVSAGDLVLLLLALEAASGALVLLVALGGRWAAHEQAVRRLVAQGAAATGLGALGVVLLAAFAGTTKLADLGTELAGTAHEPALLAGAAALLLAVGFRLGAVPFHAWAPAVNRIAESGVAAFAATAVWAGAVAVVLRLAAATENQIAGLPVLLLALGVAAMAVGVATAFPLRDLRRALAGAAAFQAGFVLAGAALRTQAGSSAAIAGAAVTVLAQTVGFVAVAHLGTPGDERAEFHLRGLAHRAPLLAGAFAVALLALAGAPPTGGFPWKWRILAGMWGEGYRVLAVVAAAASLAAVAGAVHAVARMLAPAAVAEPPVALGRLERVGLAALALLLVALVWEGAPLYRWAALAAAQLP